MSNLLSNTSDLQEVLQALQTKTVGIQATPKISINETHGIVTATAGSKSSTLRLNSEPGKTITPRTIPQTAVLAGIYTTGEVTVEGDVNLIAENIKYGKSIFGVSGTYKSDNIEDMNIIEDNFITRQNISSYYENTRVKSIGLYAFAECDTLSVASFPAAKSISAYAFTKCTNLTSINFPAVTTICSSAFMSCNNLVSVNIPATTSIYRQAFTGCTDLSILSSPAKYIGSSAFYKCYRLNSLYLTGSKVCTLSNSNAFTSTPYAGYSTYFSGTPYIYVPASLLESYKTATNWTFFSSYFSAIEES